jgi:PAS domain S-box-containing protein
MYAKHDRSSGTKLRHAAEVRLRKVTAPPRPLSRLPSSKLLQELQVHQVELELQNEELRRARSELEAARDGYLELYDFAPVGYLTLDVEGRITSVNLTGAALLGADRVDLRSRPFSRFVAPGELPRWVAHRDRVRGSEAPQGCELLLRPAHRGPFPAQITSSRTEPGPDGSTGMRCTMIDISERRHGEEERERRIAELLELNERLERTQLQLLQADKLAAIGQLAAGVAHEINNPLSYALSNLFLVEEYVGELLGTPEGAGAGEQANRPPAAHDPAEIRSDLIQCLADSRNGLERVSRVVKDLKAISHPDTGRWQAVDLRDVIDGAVRVVGSSLGAGARVVKAYPEAPLTLRCRPAQIGQVLLNVLVNASQAITPTGTISVRAGRSGHEAWVEIEDNGPGIEAYHLGRIFDPFFTTRPIGVGTGLGLSIARGIVQSHGGRVEVWSALGSGSTFRIVLPIGDEGAAPAT